MSSETLVYISSVHLSKFYFGDGNLVLEISKINCTSLKVADVCLRQRYDRKLIIGASSNDKVDVLTSWMKTGSPIFLFSCLLIRASCVRHENRTSGHRLKGTGSKNFLCLSSLMSFIFDSSKRHLSGHLTQSSSKGWRECWFIIWRKVGDEKWCKSRSQGWCHGRNGGWSISRS